MHYAADSSGCGEGIHTVLLRSVRRWRGAELRARPNLKQSGCSAPSDGASRRGFRLRSEQPGLVRAARRGGGPKDASLPLLGPLLGLYSGCLTYPNRGAFDCSLSRKSECGTIPHADREHDAASQYRFARAHQPRQIGLCARRAALHYADCLRIRRQSPACVFHARPEDRVDACEPTRLRRSR